MMMDAPNSEIDKALKKLMKKLDGDTVPVDVAVKVINSAIAWEKVKHAITDKPDPFDPDEMDR